MSRLPTYKICKNCGSRNLRVIDCGTTARYKRAGMGYRIKKCQDCGLRMSYIEIEEDYFASLFATAKAVKQIFDLLPSCFEPDRYEDNGNANSY